MRLTYLNVLKCAVLCIFGYAVESSAQSSDSAHLRLYQSSETAFYQKQGAIVGEPFLVKDPNVNGWRMYFFKSEPPNQLADYTSTAPTLAGPWSQEVEVSAGSHKMVILVDKYGYPVVVQNSYHAYTVRFTGTVTTENTGKQIHHMTAPTLAGPWEDMGVSIGNTNKGNSDAPYALWHNNQVNLFFMNVPLTGNYTIRRATNDYGSMTSGFVEKEDVITPRPGFWDEGWVGGSQVRFDPNTNNWWILYNASSSPPAFPGAEPGPSRIGFAWGSEFPGNTNRDNVPKIDNPLPLVNLWRPHAQWSDLFERWFLYFNLGDLNFDEFITYAVGK